MSEELIKKAESVNEPGSSAPQAGSPADATGAGGKPEEKSQPVDPDKFVPREQYEELEKKLGEQGMEVGDFRKFFNEVSPLLDKLQESPQIVEAIMSGKIDINLAKAVMEDKVKIEDATAVAAAHEEVKKDLGEKKYEQKSPAELEKLVEDKLMAKMGEYEKKFQKSLSDSEEKKKFTDSVNDFVRETTDFPEYADRIVGYLEDHPEIYDIRVAYDAVKGKVLIEKQTQAEKIAAAEEAKRVAANAAGGASQGAKIVQDANVIDTLISRKANPNIF